MSKVIHYDGHRIELADTPPPHLLFLTSKFQQGKYSEIEGMAISGGLATLVVVAVDEEKVVFESGKLPRTMAQLKETGEAFIMQVFDIFGSTEGILGFLLYVMGQLKSIYVPESANPT